MIRYVSLYNHKGSGVLVTNMDRGKYEFLEGFAHALAAVNAADIDYTQWVIDWIKEPTAPEPTGRDFLIVTAVAVPDWNDTTGTSWQPWTIIQGSRSIAPWVGGTE